MTKGYLQRFATWETFLAALALSVVAYAVLTVPNFATTFNLSQAAAGISEKALIVFPMLLLIIVREIDLSVAAILALCSVTLGVLLRAEVAMPVAIIAVFAVGALAGALNGALVAKVGLPSLVVTLGTMALFRGIGYIILGTGSVNQFPEAFLGFGIDLVPGTPIPWTFVPFLVLAPIFAVLLQYTPAGRRIYAIGGNLEAARLSGINVERTKLAVFAINGLMVAIAGLILSSRLGAGSPSAGNIAELDAIAACVIGGTSLAGGIGSVAGAVMGAFIMSALDNGMSMMDVATFWQYIVKGAILLLAVWMDSATKRRA
mgnify:CR=1 FL=1